MTSISSNLAAVQQNTGTEPGDSGVGSGRVGADAGGGGGGQDPQTSQIGKKRCARGREWAAF